jgi:hypothetical protein
MEGNRRRLTPPHVGGSSKPPTLFSELLDLDR